MEQLELANELAFSQGFIDAVEDGEDYKISGQHESELWTSVTVVLPIGYIDIELEVWPVIEVASGQVVGRLYDIHDSVIHEENLTDKDHADAFMNVFLGEEPALDNTTARNLSELLVALNTAGWHAEDVDQMDAYIGAVKLAKALAVKMSSPYKHYENIAREQIQKIMNRTKITSWTTDTGRAYITKTGESVSFNRDALEALYQSTKKGKEMLGPHRKTKPTGGALTIK